MTSCSNLHYFSFKEENLILGNMNEEITVRLVTTKTIIGNNYMFCYKMMIFTSLNEAPLITIVNDKR